MAERKIAYSQVEETLLKPEQILVSNKGRKIAQRTIGNRMLRVVYKETDKVYIIVTVHYTRLGRYQNESTIR